VVSDLIVGIIVYVDGHIFVKDLQGLSVVWIASTTRDFIVLHAAEFVVLDPKVGLENLKCRWKPEQSSVSRRESTRMRTWCWQRPRRSLCGCGDCGKQPRANCSRSKPERFA
jgi:hypothetical protein